MNLEKLNKWGESRNIEVKKEIPNNHKKYMKTVIGFANGFGGCLIFGIEEKNGSYQVVGLEGDVFQLKDSITNAIFSSCEPHVVPDISLDTWEGKTVLIVKIHAGWDRPYYLKSEGEYEGIYVRVAGTTRKADRLMLKELMFEGSNRYFDRTICLGIDITKKDVEDLCTKLYELAYKRAKVKESVVPLTENDLLSWGILTTVEGKLVPSNAYGLLIGHPYLPNRIQCALFKGVDRTEVIDMKEFTGPIYEQIEFAYQFVLRNIRMSATFEGLYRQNNYEIPVYVIRELLVNAIAHRSYIDRGCVKVAIYDDRIEVISPGKLPLSQTIEKMKEGSSVIRNEAIAYVLRYLNYIENWGRGIPRILKTLQEQGLKEPDFIGGETELMIRIYRKNNEIMGVRENMDSFLSMYSNASLLSLIQSDSSLTQKEYAQQLGKSERTVKRMFKDLQDKKIIKRIGNNRSGRWILLVENEIV